MSSEMGIDDPVWFYILCERLKPYLPYIRKWWDDVESLACEDTGLTLIDEPDAPGLYYRFTRSSIRSPIRGIQAFPFVVAGFLQLSGIPGGSTKMVQHLLNEPREFEEFMLIEIHNLPSTYNQGQLIAFVPKDIYEGTRELGSWVYLTKKELSGLLKGHIYPSLTQKAVLRA